jgi:hypothetical protein
MTDGLSSLSMVHMRNLSVREGAGGVPVQLRHHNTRCLDTNLRKKRNCSVAGQRESACDKLGQTDG